MYCTRNTTKMSTKKQKHLRSKEKKMIASTSQHFEENRATAGLSFIQQTMKATGVSRRTIFRVRKELRETGTLASSQRSKRRPYKPVDDFDETVIRNKIHEFYTQRHQLPTLSNLLTVLRGEINYPGSRWHLHQTLELLSTTAC